MQLREVLQAFIIFHNEQAGEPTWAHELDEHINAFYSLMEEPGAISQLKEALEASRQSFFEDNWHMSPDDSTADMGTDAALMGRDLTIYKEAEEGLHKAKTFMQCCEDLERSYDEMQQDITVTQDICRRAVARSHERQQMVFELRKQLAAKEKQDGV